MHKIWSICIGTYIYEIILSYFWDDCWICVYLFVNKTIYKQNKMKMWSVQGFFFCFKEIKTPLIKVLKIIERKYWVIITVLSRSYTVRETIATLALLYNNSSIQLLLYTLPPMDYELEIFNYCIDLKKCKTTYEDLEILEI